MTWRRKSVHSDGSPSGDRKFAFRQSPVPGVEANLTKISRNSHKQRPAFHRYSLCSNPPSQPLYGLFSRPGGNKAVKPVFIHFSHENTRSTPATHTTRRSTLFNSYPQHVRPALLVPLPLALHSFKLLHLLFYAVLLTRFILLSGPIPPPSPTRCNSNTIVHHPSSHSSPFLFIAYDTMPLCAL